MSTRLKRGRAGDDVAVRVIRFPDPGRPEAASEMEELQRRGWEVARVARDPEAPGGLRIELRAPAAVPARGRSAGRPLRILCLHGVHHEEGAASSEGPWLEAIRTAVSAHGAPEPEIRWVSYNAAFAAAGIDAGDVLAASARLAVSSVWHGIGDLFRTRSPAGPGGARGLGDTLRWTAGMVVQWAENEALRAALRRLLRAALAGEDGRPDVLLAHSLGSLIAYDTLARPALSALGRGLTLVTFGSQIGYPAVRAVFGGRIVPIPGLRRWFHLYNRHDHAFTAPLDVRFPAAAANPNFVQLTVPFDLPDDPLNHDAGAYLGHRETGAGFWRFAVASLGSGNGGEGRGAGAGAGTGAVRDGVVPAGAGRPLPGVRSARLVGGSVPGSHGRGPHGRFARALLVGIGDYPRAEDVLEGCVNDVFLMSELLQRRGFPAENIRIVLNERATAEGIRERLQWLLDGADDEQDRVFYYAGHGAQIPGYGAGEVVDRRDECLVPYDFDWSDPRTAITDDWFHELYSQLPEGTRFLTLLDCCHSGGMARHGGLRARGLMPPDDIRHRLMRWDGHRGGFEERPLGDRSVRAARQRRDDLYGERGDLRGLGRAVGLRLPPRQFAAARKAFGHHGPFLPIILEACQERELANEVRLGARSHGAFTWCLAETLRQWPAARAMNWEALVREVAAELERQQFRQTPRLVCPSSMRTAPVPWDRTGPSGPRSGSARR